MFNRRRFSGHHKAPSFFGAPASLALLSVMLLFWTLSEGIVSFITPLKIEESGVSDTMLGVILGTSSIAGAVFDLLAARLFHNTYYKRVFAGMFGLCLLYPLIIFHATVPALFVLGMIVWGVYYDLRNIGNFDFIARTTNSKTSAHNFGVLQVFQSVGWIVGPILVGFLVGEEVGWKPFVAIYIFLAIAIFFFVLLCFLTGKRHSPEQKTQRKECKRGSWSEAKLLSRVGYVLFPALVTIFFLNFTDAFFWSIGPLFAEHIGLGQWAGLFVTAWSLPGLLLGWHAGKIAIKYGKERTAYVGQLLGSLCLIPLFLFTTGPAVLITVFVAASFTSLSWPAIQGAFADYISSRPDLDKEIESLEDLYTNLGYAIGPMLAGFMADTVGYAHTFTMLGVLGAATALTLIITHPKRIRLFKDRPALICEVE
jgi:MFS family permease